MEKKILEEILDHSKTASSLIFSEDEKSLREGCYYIGGIAQICVARLREIINEENDHQTEIAST